MTMVASGQIDLVGSATSGGLNRSINLEFGYGGDLSVYRGAIYTNAAGTAALQFPKAPNSISMSDFYNSRKIPAGSSTFSANGTFTVPVYNTLTVIIRAAGGQGSGATGADGCNLATTYPSVGATGGASQFGKLPAAVYGSAPGGTGGNTTAASGAIDGTTQSGYGYGGNTSNAGGAPASGGTAGSGGGGGVTVLTITNPLAGGSGPSTGQSVSVVVGTCVASANGASNYIFSLGQCFPQPASASGAAGKAGSVVVSWQ